MVLVKRAFVLALGCFLATNANALTLGLAAFQSGAVAGDESTELIVSGAMDTFFDLGVIVTSARTKPLAEEDWGGFAPLVDKENRLDYILVLFAFYDASSSGVPILRRLEHRLFSAEGVSLLPSESVVVRPNLVAGGKNDVSRMLRSLGGNAAATYGAFFRSAMGGKK